MFRGGAGLHGSDLYITQDAWLDWDLGYLEARSTPWTLWCVPQTLPEQFLWCVSAHCPAGRATAIGECHCLERVCSVVCIKWHPHECQDPRFSSRALQDNIISVITCQWVSLILPALRVAADITEGTSGGDLIILYTLHEAEKLSSVQIFHMNKNAFMLSMLYVCFGTCMYTNILKKNRKIKYLTARHVIPNHYRYVPLSCKCSFLLHRTLAVVLAQFNAQLHYDLQYVR